MSRRLPRAWSPTLAVALAALTGRQATRARRRDIDVSPVVSAVDVTVNPAGRHPDAVQRDAGPPVRMVTFGDSGMAGVGVEREADALPVQLAQRVANRIHRDIHVASYARSGARTADVLTEQVPLVALKATCRCSSSAPTTSPT